MTFPGTFFSRRSSALPRHSSGAKGPHSSLQHPSSPAYSDWSREDQHWVERFDAFLETHLCDSGFDIPLIAEEFAMSESTLLRQVKRLLHTTPGSYLRQRRLMRAYHLIQQNPDLPVRAVATQVGYENHRSFSRSFQEYFGRKPGEVACDS